MSGTAVAIVLRSVSIFAKAVVAVSTDAVDNVRFLSVVI